MNVRVALFAALIGLIVRPAAGYADDTTLRDLCPDRPGKGTSACTVDQGHFQIEVELFNDTSQHQDGVSTNTFVYPNPTIKYGLTDSWDIEANLVPYVSVHTRDAQSGSSQEDGIGDLYLRSKWAVIGNGGSDFAVAVEPFVKIPTAAQAIGNGTTETGVLVPISLDLGDNWSFGTTPELDFLKDAQSSSLHPALIAVAGISRGFDNGVTLGAELWQSRDFDPSRTGEQASFDFTAAWIPSNDKNLQLDAGINFGLTNETANVQFYSGITRRF